MTIYVCVKVKAKPSVLRKDGNSYYGVTMLTRIWYIFEKVIKKKNTRRFYGKFFSK